MQKSVSLPLSLVCYVVGSSLQFNPALAQVTPDGTTSTTVDVSGNDFTINNGDRAGSNLFHSFGEFSVPNGGSAFFNNAADIANVFSRVTGGNISNIDGLLRANGAANLFLINPAGIIFGEGARLDIGGSFYGSTADSVLFPDGEFSASDLDNSPLITINAPIGLNFRDQPNPITTNNTEDLFNSNLNLIGGDININSRLLGNTITLGGLSDSGIVSITEQGDLSFPDAVNKANLSVNNNASLGVFSSNGSINLQGNNITIDNNSSIIAVAENDINLQADNSILIDNGSSIIAQVLDDQGKNAGDINLNAGAQVSLDNASFLINQVGNQDTNNAIGNSGNININTNSLELNNASFILTNIQGQGTAGNVTINASDNVVINNSDIQAKIEELGEGTAGNVEITTNDLLLQNRARILSDTQGIGNAGNTIINAINGVTLDNSEIFSGVGLGDISTPAQGEGGDVIVNSNSLVMQNDARIFASILNGQGIAGNIIINATDNVVLNNSNLQTRIEELGEGTAGNVEITTNDLLLQNRSRILSDTQGIGNAGNTIINATNTVSLDNSDIASGVGLNGITTQAQGEGGDVVINSNSLIMQNISRIFANIANGKGTAGNVTINTTDNVVLNNSDIQAKIEELGEGTAGNVEITTNDLLLQNGALILSDTQGIGNAGNTIINTTNTVSLDDSEIVSGVGLGGITTQAQGEGGDVLINTNSFSLQNNSQILANITNGKGQAGNVIINANDNVVLNNSNLQAKIEELGEGIAGNVEITTSNFFLENGALILSDTQGIGNAGDIIINATESTNLDNNSRIISAVNENAIGNAGNIEILANSVEITGDSQLIANTQGQGNSGQVSITAQDSITITGESNISSRVRETAIGDAGGISITGNSVLIDQQSILNSETVGQGNGRDITILANEIFTLDGNSLINAQVSENAIGNAGNIEIIANSVEIKGDSNLIANTRGQGNAGQVSITAQDSVTITGESNISSRVRETGIGNAGGISIIGNSFSLDEKSIFDSGTVGQGNGSEISINAPLVLIKDNSSLKSETTTEGNAGNISINNADLVTVTDGGRLTVRSTGTGNTGNIEITANSLEINQGEITAETTSGELGNINLTINEDITLRNNSLVSARASGDANGGNITIAGNNSSNSRFIIAFPSSGNGNDIVATAERGNGGNITINARQIFNLQEGRAIDSNGNLIPNNRNDIDASSQADGLDGTISIFNPDTNTLQTETEVPSNLLESEQTFAQACQSNPTSDKPSGLTVKGKGGVSPAPTKPFDSETILVDEEITNSNIQANYPEIKPIKTSMGDIYPARGIIKTEDGKIILTAYSTDNTNTRTPHNSANCIPS
ncbi:MAG: beta strand repeat-containing protein [Xenococcus sp. (in: cyanobacteria)]